MEVPFRDRAQHVCWQCLYVERDLEDTACCDVDERMVNDSYLADLVQSSLASSFELHSPTNHRQSTKSQLTNHRQAIYKHS